LVGIEKKGEENLTIGDAQIMLTNMMSEIKSSASEQFTKELETKMEAINKLIEEKASVELIETKMNEMALKMDQFAEKMRPAPETKSVMDRLSDEIIEKAIPEIKAGNNNVKFEVKSITSTELALPNYNTNVDPNAKMPTLRKATILDVIPTVRLNKRNEVKIALGATVTCGYQAENTNVVVATSTGTATETTFKAQKIKAVATQISREALLEDTPSIMPKLFADMELQRRLYLENQCLNGLGSSSVATAIWGIIPQFTTAFNATTSATADKVTAPNIYDLALAMKTQAEVAANNREYMPTVIVVSPATWFEIQTTKDAENRPLMIDGMLGGEFTVLKNRTLGDTEMLLIDPSTLELHIGRDWEIQLTQISYDVTVGQETSNYSDALSDTFTMIAWFRGLLAMNLADKAGNIYVANIATELGNIAKPA
jgi:hypothetical protein